MKDTLAVRENNFNILHLFGAILVMYGHQYVLVSQASPVLLGSEINALGVKIIFVISGYLITQSYLNSKKIIPYIIKRMIRIFPALIFSTLGSVFILGLITTTVSPMEYIFNSIEFIKGNILLYPIFKLPGVFADNYYPATVNGSLWTLPVEFAVYLVIPLFVLLSNIMKQKQKFVYSCLVGLVVVMFAINYYLFPTSKLIIYGTDWLQALKIIPYFLIGSLFSYINLKKYLNLQIAVSLFVATCCFNLKYLELMALFVLPYFVLSLALCPNPIFCKLFNKTNISYGVYLWAFPIQQTVIQIMCIKYKMSINTNILFLVSLFFTIFMAYLSCYFIERPVNKLFAKLDIHKRIV